ncbi:Uncharacterised protein [Vibrio cholerae]|uniref:Uncharacterized protein n=1 Tax=Vibrio cholerae TaxID=666 RepID=A0A656AXI8_VIBCL|nr:Uncharacterised protein [Vibrio cholerae]
MLLWCNKPCVSPLESKNHFGKYLHSFFLVLGYPQEFGNLKARSTYIFATALQRNFQWCSV